jgi:REP element-mobilizing transposase RayT
MVWHVKESRPWLTPSVEKIVHDYLRGYVVRTPGAFVHEIGGTETHVHMAVTVPPTLGISELIGKLKGSSAHEANAKLGQKRLEWQSGYGVVSFGTKDLDCLMRLKPNIENPGKPGSKNFLAAPSHLPSKGGPSTAKGGSPVNRAEEPRNRDM